MKMKAEAVMQASKQLVPEVVQKVVVPVLYHRQGCRMVRALAQLAQLEGGAQSPVEWLQGAAVAGAVQVLGAAQGPNPKGPRHPIAMPVQGR